MPKFHHVSVLHDVLLPLRANLSFLAGFCHGAEFKKLVPRDDFSANELVAEIRVNSRTSFGRSRTSFYCPGTSFFFSGREIRNEVEQFVPPLDERVDSVVCHSELASEVATFVVMHIREVALDTRIYRHILRAAVFQEIAQLAPSLAILRVHIYRTRLSVQYIEHRFHRDEMECVNSCPFFFIKRHGTRRLSVFERGKNL